MKTHQGIAIAVKDANGNAPMTSDLTPERRRELVLAAIDRIKQAHDLSLAATTVREGRLSEIEAESALRGFGLQWRNVEALLRG